jgi:hypothetical protein
MRDLLVRYLLGELDVDERRWLEERLSDSPELRRELAYLRECLPEAGDTCKPAAEPPSGLAERTVERISDWDSEPDGRRLETIPCGASAFSGEVFSGSATPYWSFVDLTVAGGVLLAVSMLFLPALRQSRDASRRMICANNLHQMHGMLAVYSDRHGRHFPIVHQDDNAGIFAVLLVDSGIVSADDLNRLLVCPSSPLAERVAAGVVVIRIPTMAVFRAASGEQLAEFRRWMGGSYAYRIGYRERGHYCNLRDSRCPRTPLMADEPCYLRVDLKSMNHGGCGQNVLYQDGSVRYLKSCKLPNRDDHLFLNAEGEPAAGCGPLDTVLGRSDATPGVVGLEIEQ